MNFTDSPYEKMMKEVPRPGHSGASPCGGCREYRTCGGQPGRCKKKYRSLFLGPSGPSGQPGPKSK